MGESSKTKVATDEHVLLVGLLVALTRAQSRKRARRAADNEVIGLWLKQG